MNNRMLLIALMVQVAALCLFSYQFFTSVFGFSDLEVSWEVHEMIEISSVVGLLIGLLITLLVLKRSNSRNQRVEEQLAMASNAFHSVLLDKFKQWSLTPTEQEVAIMIVKGFSISEIADMRGKSEGTIKAHNSAIYAKSGLAGRVQFVSFFLEELTSPL